MKKAKAAQATALDPKNFVDFRVAKVTTVNHNTKIITLALDDEQKLGTNGQLQCMEARLLRMLTWFGCRSPRGFLCGGEDPRRE